MNKYLFISAAALLLSACGGGSGGESTQTQPSLPPPVETPVDDGFDQVRTVAQTQLAASVAPAVSIAIYKDGEIVFAEAYGKKVVGEAADVDTNTLFQLGSTTKVFTGLAALQMVEDAHFSLNTSLLDALPGIQIEEAKRQNWQDINLQHLLTHQGGFQDYVDWDDQITDFMKFATTVYPNTYGQMNPAGRFWNYSNPNFSYLGAIVESQSGTVFQDIMEQEVFQPLGMPRTTMRPAKVEEDGNFALGAGYVIRNGQTVEGEAQLLSEIHEGVFGVAGGSYTWSTPTELLKMAEFLLNGNEEVLADNLRTQITSPQVALGYGDNRSYGYGLFVGDGFRVEGGWYPVKAWEHGGNTMAYSNEFWVLPEENVAVVVMSSGQNTNFRDTVVAAMSAVVAMPSPEFKPREPVATELFENHVGRYSDGEVNVDVFLEDDELRVNVPAFDAQGIDYEPALIPFSESVFLVEIDEERLDLTFVPEEEGGNSTYIRNRGFVLIRADEVAGKFNSNISKQSQLPSMVPVSLTQDLAK